MAQAHAASGQVVGVGPLGPGLAQARTSALIKAAQLEVVRIVLPAGKSLREHAAPGEITVQCIEGEVEFTVDGALRLLRPGDWLHLQARAPHALTARSDASLLVTMCLLPAP